MMPLASTFSPRLRGQFAAAQALGRRWREQSESGLAERQLAALREHWADAVADVPYYQQLVATGAAPAEIRDWASVRAIPVLTRAILQQQPSAFLRRSGPPKTFITTAGSTGTPLTMGLTQEERDLMRVVKLAAWQAFGYDPSSRLFLIWGHSHLLGTGWRGRLNHLKRRAKDAALGYRRVDAYHLNRALCRTYAAQLIRFRPIGLIGYAAALDLFARYTQEFRDRFRSLGMRFVLATAEAPPAADTIPLIEDLFGCPVVQEYGGAEFNQVAFKVSREPFETYGDLNFVEAGAPEPDGTEPLLVTSLYRRYLPLIRYQVGDAATGLTRLEHGHVRRFDALAGRVNDILHLEGGEAVHSVAVFHCVHQERVHNIQMVLHDDGIVLRLVSSAPDRPAMEARIRQRLTQVHPSLGRVRFEYAEDLETNRAGKRRWFVDHREHPPCVALPAS